MRRRLFTRGPMTRPQRKLLLPSLLTTIVQAIGIVIETDAALPMGAQLLRTLGLVAESNTALPMGARLQRELGLVAETDSVLAMQGRAIVAVGLVVENGIALPLGSAALISVGLVAEADLALPMTARLQRVLGLVAENDAALAMAARLQRELGLVAEADAALALQTGSGIVGLVGENDQALPMVARVTRAIGLVAEADLVLPMTRTEGRTLGLVGENDQVLPIGARIARITGPVAETDLALPMNPVLPGTLGLVLEIEVALSMTASPNRGVGLVSENDLALQLLNPDLQGPLMPPPLATTTMYATATAYVARFGIEEAAQLLADEEELLTTQLLQDVLRGTWTGSPSMPEQNAAIAAQARLERQLGVCSNFMDGYLRSVATLPLEDDDKNAGTLEDCCLALTRYALADDADNATERMDKTADTWRTWLNDVARGRVQLIGGDGAAAPARGRVRTGQVKSGFNWGGFGGGQ